MGSKAYVAFDHKTQTYHRYRTLSDRTACGEEIPWCKSIMFITNEHIPCATCWPELNPPTTVAAQPNPKPKEPI